MNTIEDGLLTEEDIQTAMDKSFGRHVPPLVAVGSHQRAIAHAAARKMAWWLRQEYDHRGSYVLTGIFLEQIGLEPWN